MTTRKVFESACIVCGNPAANGRMVCHGCREETRLDDEKRNYEKWISLCPPLYLQTDRKKLPRPEKLDEVMSWTYGSAGLLLYGPTGLGKSRCAWKLLEREVCRHGRIVRAPHGLDLSIKLPSLMGSSMTEADEYIERLCGCEILLLDDPFKSKLTDRSEEILFHVISYRHEQLRPTITTLNDTGQSLATRMTTERGGPTVRRLKDSSRVVLFI